MWTATVTLAECGVSGKTVPTKVHVSASLLVPVVVVMAACGGDDDTNPSVIASTSDGQPGAEPEPVAIVSPMQGDDLVTVTLTLGPAE